MIVSGLNGQAIVRGFNNNNRIHSWVETDQSWSNLGGATVRSISSGQGGRLYKVDYKTNKIFE